MLGDWLFEKVGRWIFRLLLFYRIISFVDVLVKFFVYLSFVRLFSCHMWIPQVEPKFLNIFILQGEEKSRNCYSQYESGPRYPQWCNILFKRSTVQHFFFFLVGLIVLFYLSDLVATRVTSLLHSPISHSALWCCAAAVLVSSFLRSAPLALCKKVFISFYFTLFYFYFYFFTTNGWRHLKYISITGRKLGS